MAISDKLSYLADTKDQIRQAIQGKGVPVGQEEPFRNYAARIGEITGGGGGGGTEIPKWINSSWSEYVTSTSATAPALDQLAPGDLLLLTVMARADIVSVPTGFVEEARSPVVGSNEQWAVVFTKIADGTEEEFEVVLDSNERTCVSVSSFRSSSGSPEVLIGSSALIEQSETTEITWDGVPNPSSELGGVLVVIATSDLAQTSGDRVTNLPFYGFSSIHNMYGSTTFHQNRMMICARAAEAGETFDLFSPRTAIQPVPTFSSLTLLVY